MVKITKMFDTHIRIYQPRGTTIDGTVWYGVLIDIKDDGTRSMVGDVRGQIFPLPRSWIAV